MSARDYRFDSEDIAHAIAQWSQMESPSYVAQAVNAMMEHAAQLLARLGADISYIEGRDGFGAAVKATFDWGSGGPPILVLGHLDTVHGVGSVTDALPVRREGDRLYGPGVQDMKGGMYLAIHALEKVIERHGSLNVPVVFLLIPDEEVGSPTTRAVIESHARGARCVLVPEPAHDHKLVTGRHAFLRYRLHTYGQPAHAGVARGVGRSAIAVMAKVITQVESFSDVQRETTYRVGVVHGGEFVNVIPTACHAQVLCVAPTHEAFAEVTHRMNELRSPEPDVRLEVEAGPIRPLFEATPGTLELFEVARRIGEDIGLNLEHGQFGGGSDGNFTGALGIPTLDGLGVVGAGLHTHNEHILVSELVPRAQLLAGLYEAISTRNRFA